VEKHGDELAALEALDNGAFANGFILSILSVRLATKREDIQLGEIHRFSWDDWDSALLCGMGR
jgi:hypothetical protein